MENAQVIFILLSNSQRAQWVLEASDSFKCGKSGCPLFWKTTMPLRPCGKNLLAEAYFAPLKLTHENKRLSNLVEKEYIGLPEYLNQRNDIIGAKCFQTSVDRWENLPYVIQKKSELKSQIEELQCHIPEIESLIVVGKSLEKTEPAGVTLIPPKIIIEEIAVQNDVLDETIPILQLGSRVLKGSNDEKVSITVEFTPVIVPQTHARGILIANRGSIAIEYWWKKERPVMYELPLQYSRNVLTRFFFNKCDGILLPGQSFVHRFMFMSRTSGIYREEWRLSTIPPLPEIQFILEAVASQKLNKENEHISYIESYLDGCIKRTAAHELAESIVHCSAPCPEEKPNPYSSKFLEKDIFHHINPLLYYDMDAIRDVKELYSRYFPGTWNLSMSDLCDMLIEKLKYEDEAVKSEVMNMYCNLLCRLQKRPIDVGIEERDWEMLKYDLCYMVMCAAIAEMEKSMRHKNWGLIPPPRPPGPEGEYSGEVFNFINNERYDANFGLCRSSDPASQNTDEVNSTEDEEERIREEELKMHDFENEDEMDNFAFSVSPKIEFDLDDEIIFATRRWPYNFAKNEHMSKETIKRDTKALKESKKGTKDLRRKSEKSLNEKEKPAASRNSLPNENKEFIESISNLNTVISEPSPELLSFHRKFVIMNWRHILGEAIDKIVEIVDKINLFRRERTISDPMKSDRFHHSCIKHSMNI